MKKQIITFKQTSTDTEFKSNGGLLEIEKSSAGINEKVKARYFLVDNEKIEEIFLNQGNIKLINANGIKEIEEDITFIDEKEGNLRYRASEIVDIKFTGSYRGGGNLRIDGNRLIFANNTTGIVRVKYKITFKEYEIVGSMEGSQLVVFITNKAKNHGIITRADIVKDVVLRVEDIYTGEPLSNASVYIDGEYKGLTDVNGYIKLGKMGKGRYNLKILKAGYKSNLDDNIQNEVLIIE